MAKTAPKTIVKKVSAFPIDAQITGPAGVSIGKIVKLTKIGMMVETEVSLAVGQQFSINFTLPVSNANILAVGVVVKSYAHYGGQPGKNKSHYLTEIHFRSLTEGHTLELQRFLKAIKQL